ncbi:MAG: CRISPR system precrRNA processing endoribonuclease RAMP protein Cas6 [Chloroflexi bacterium]|nr:CRISPR system precrRNA processing endoribonuclease RAMP protein Cas6 [Chloroflexota bacterium]
MLYSIILELTATNQATIPATMGHQAHALFLDLIRQVEPELATRLHDEPNYRPFTVGPLDGGRVQGQSVSLRPGQPCRLRLTLLDGGRLWQCLSTQFLEAGPLQLRLGAAEFRLDHLLATPKADPTGWAGFSDWPTLAATPPSRYITIRFATPTAFNMGDKHFTLFPEPTLLWDSFMRVWNIYAPEVLRLDKIALRDYIKEAVIVSDYELQTTTLHFPSSPQKGFVGLCTYRIGQQNSYAAQLAALAEFSRYAGAGYKTTMGMGQSRSETSLRLDQTT